MGVPVLLQHMMCSMPNVFRPKFDNRRGGTTANFAAASQQQCSAAAAAAVAVAAAVVSAAERTADINFGRTALLEAIRAALQI